MARILLVDDDEPVLKALRLLFASEGHQVVPVKEGKRAFELIQSEEAFDVLVTDIRMAPPDGLQIIRLAREKRPQLPILVISAYYSPKDVKQAMDAGCAEYLKKPFKTDEVLNAVRRALSQAKPATPPATA